MYAVVFEAKWWSALLLNKFKSLFIAFTQVQIWSSKVLKLAIVNPAFTSDRFFFIYFLFLLSFFFSPVMRGLHFSSTIFSPQSALSFSNIKKFCLFSRCFYSSFSRECLFIAERFYFKAIRAFVKLGYEGNIEIDEDRNKVVISILIVEEDCDQPSYL